MNPFNKFITLLTLGAVSLISCRPERVYESEIFRELKEQARQEADILEGENLMRFPGDLGMIVTGYENKKYGLGFDRNLTKAYVKKQGEGYKLIYHFGNVIEPIEISLDQKKYEKFYSDVKKYYEEGIKRLNSSSD